MPLYNYKAATVSGKTIRGSLDAPNEKTAVSRLQDMDYIPIWIGEAAADAGSTRHGRYRPQLRSVSLGSVFSRISQRDVMLFTQDLAGLLKAGVPVDRALSILTHVTESARFQATLKELLKSVQAGAYLSDAMSRHPRVFSDFYVNMVRAGEAGGVLETVLERLGIFLENRKELRDYIVSALVYPIFLVVVGSISIVILMTFVIPKFSVIFSDMGDAIPWSTQMLLDFSHVVRHYWWAMILTFGGVVVVFRQYGKSPGGRLRLDRLKLRIPAVGDFVRKVEVARFTRTLGTLVKSGVPILQALSLVRAILDNRIFADAMDRIYKRVKEGDRLSSAMTEADVFPVLAVQMITVGEESGKLDAMLLRVAEQYEKTVKNLVKRWISLLEPCLILFMGLVVGFIVISMLMAIFSINDISF